MTSITLIDEAECVGWLASSIACFLKTGDERRLRQDFNTFLRSPACDPDLPAVLPSTKRERRKHGRGRH